MKRRLALLGGSLGAVVLLYLIYLAITGVGAKRPAVPPAPPVEVSRTPATRGVVEPEEGTDFRTTDRDQQGRLRRVFSAPAYKRTEEGVYVLTQPKAMLYQADGQQVQITAAEGTVHTRVLRSGPGSMRLSVVWGELRGDVKLYLDRAPPAEGPPVEERISDPNVVQVTADNVHFDNDKLLLYTNDRVHVTSQQVEISGHGLSMQWNEDPQELQMLRLEHGDSLVVRYAPGQEETELLGLPTGGLPGAAPEALELTATAPVETMPVAIAASEPTAQELAAAARRRGKNVYVATFYGDVRVAQGARYIRGADSLSMEFQWARAMVERTGEQAGPTATPERPAAPAAAEGEAPAVEARAAAPSPATQPTAEPVTITWSGPVEILPTGYTDTPSRRNVTVSGQGTAVNLFDGETSALCREFEFRRVAGQTGDRRLGRLTGAADSPAMLSLAGGEQIFCPLMLFEMSVAGDKARLQGAGYMVRPAGRGGTSGELAMSSALSSAGGEPAGSAAAPIAGEEGEDLESISWRDSVDAVIARDESAQGGIYIREACFRGDVEVSGGDTGDRLRCDELLVAVERRPLDGAGRARTAITSVTATGHVVVGGGTEQGRWQAFADDLRGNPSARTAVMRGEPVRHTGRDSALIAGEVHFQAFRDPNGQFVRGAGIAQVDGPGRLEMLMDKDLSGAQLATPRPSTVTWTREMRYVDFGRSGLGPQQGPDLAPATAMFFGEVHLVSGDEDMTCGHMRATFAESTASGAGGDRLNLGAVNYGGPLWKVFANQNVVLVSERRDDQRRVRGLVELRTESMVYDAIARTVDSQAGWLLVQDLRPPRAETGPRSPEVEAATPMPGANLESPSQTYFEWYKTMHLAMDGRMVELLGNVSMRHASSDAIVERDILQQRYGLVDWPQPLPSGRLTDLRCERLLARFAAPTPAEPNAPADEFQAGLNLIGPLDLFVATGAVQLWDEPWEVVGEKLTYARQQDLVTVLGAADGSDRANAQIRRKEADRVVTNDSPWLRWFRREDRIETGPMTGSGVVLPSGSSGR
ncbi:MAG: hypothetical protein MUP47_05665 [Phycisphaerae bacterium]|nr:hypothetical protein [Phycisphaerae bacterium]